ncbi:hypothetical protein [Pseudofulvibacter geojedonensis]|uniref:Uncharacterized protein n=1 Tax=Pseudofulvibacter geojedonensis TaxID=1123758 RepID=A0ABW3I3M5_9FLAO
MGFSQESLNNRIQKKLAVTDSILLDSVSINPYKFKVLNKQFQPIDSTFYKIDFAKSILTFNNPIATDSVYVEYTKYPDFLTKEYFLFDEKLIVQDNSSLKKLYKLGTSNTQRNFTPFNGLETSGSISRGIAVGNNQNSVLNSELDLQVSGKISDNVSLRASLQDANIPLQEGGYSQRLDEFDQVFVELFSDNWLLRAGDVNLENKNSYFGRFTKKVQGIYGTGTIKRDSSATNFFASGAIVRGQYTRSTFQGQEGNQGPYKLSGPNGELFVLLVSGSETVYVNGIRLERGENNDYIIDYNAGEIIFNATYPITSEMRINVEYQYSDRNYSRIIAYGGGSHENKKLSVSAHVYTENDAKNQPLQQNLSSEQVSILADAGDDNSLMTAPSESLEAYSENKILYKKELIGGVEAFVFSNNPDDELYQVRFSLVGENQGNYVLVNSNAISNIYEYVAPFGGIPQGNYEPIIQLIAPTKLQMAVVDASYKPNEKTEIEFELAGSKNDLNLFSSIDDENNNGFAGKLTVNRKLIKRDSSWNLNAFVDTDYIDKNFRTIERLYRIEFDRDWNLETPLGHQNIIRSGLNLYHHKRGFTNYTFEHLNYSENYNGNRHVLTNDLKFNKLRFSSNSSYLTSSSSNFNSTFLRLSAQGIYDLKKAWVGAKTSIENNQQKDNTTQLLTGASQKYNSYEAFTGIGDSTKVYATIGYKYRVNDSLRNGFLEKVNTSNTYYLRSRILNTNSSKLSLHANYRTLTYTDENLEDEKSVNSRILYQQHFWKQFLRFNTTFEMNAGVVPQQDFTYVAVDEGQGFYTWIDYNSNGIQELNEFEVAQFQDQATFIKVLLPNQVFVKTQQNKWSASLAIDPKNWINSNSSFKKIASHFFNQTSFLLDKKTKRNNSIGFNLFETDEDQFITVNSSFKNSLFYKRGKQHFSTTYSYLQSKSRNILSIGFQENKSKGHQLQFTHKFFTNWLFDLKNNLNNTENASENFANNNFEINEISFFPKLSYLASENTKFDAFYEFTNKENQVSDFEKLNQQRMGVSFSIAKQDKISLNGEFNYYLNNFEGSSFSPVAYQMLEGLEKGKNLTWSLFAQKRITKFLDLNISYFGRKTETSQVIHTGNIQLKAFF